MTKQRNSSEESMNLIDRLSGKAPDLLTAGAADDLLAISGLAQKEVEWVVAEAYRRQGYQVVALATSTSKPDAGMLLTKATQRLLLQCKYWSTRKIAEMPVRELYGMMAAHSANAGILITSGSFTLEAYTKPTRGTDVILHLKEEDKEYLQPWRLRQLVKKYSDFVEHPIVMDVEKEEGGEKKTTLHISTCAADRNGTTTRSHTGERLR